MTSKIIRCVATLMLCLCSALGAKAQQDAVFVYRNDGAFDAFLYEDVDSMTISNYDSDGMWHSTCQTQVIYTPDGAYHIPLAAIDSIAFHAAAPEYKQGVVHLDESYQQYVISSTDSTILLDSSAPSAFIPAVGEICVNDEYDDVFPKGFFGRLSSVEHTPDGMLCRFDKVGLSEVYSRLVVVGCAESYNDTDDSPSKKRIFEPKTKKRVWMPSSVDLSVSLKDLLRKESTVDGGISLTLEKPKLVLDYFICYDEKNLKDYVKFKSKLSSRGSVSASANISGSYEPEPHWSKKPIDINVYGISGSINFGIYFEASGDIDFNYEVPFQFQCTRGFEYSEDKGYRELDEEKRKDRFNWGDPEWNLNLNGSISAGLAARLALGVVHSEFVSVDVTTKVGRQVSANFKIASGEEGKTEINKDLYSALKNAEISTSIRLKIDPGYKLWFKDRASFGAQLTLDFDEETRSLLPSFSTPAWNPMLSNGGHLISKVTNDVFIPVELGWVIYDKDGAEYSKTYFPSSYLLNDKWTHKNMEQYVSGLPESYEYKAYPIIKLMKWEIPIDEYALMKKVECPVRVVSCDVVNSEYKKGHFMNDGSYYDYKYLCATTVETSDDIDWSQIEDWGYVYRDQNYKTTYISLAGKTAPYTDTRYAFYRNEPSASVCLYGYVKYYGEDIMTERNPHNFFLQFKYSLSCPDENHPHAIDLGLPSGTKWSCCNVGAESPTAPCEKYAWGMTIPWTDYDDYSFTDIGSDIAGTPYDAAFVNMGAPWQMPSIDQLEELSNCCLFANVIIDDVGGYLLLGPNGNSILFARDNIFLSSTLDPDNYRYAYRMEFFVWGGKNESSKKSFSRASCNCIRAVCQ